MKTTIFSLLCVVLCGLLAFTGPLVIDPQDQEFVMAAADGGMLEVKLGELANQKGVSPKIKSFGKQMITDHNKVNNELKSLAKKKQIDIPAQLSTAKQAQYDSLAALSGDEFDMLYMNMMLASHEETIGVFQTESNKGQDAELKKWADSKIPALKHHLEMAKVLFPAKMGSQSGHQH